jgi:hypothetical protein
MARKTSACRICGKPLRLKEEVFIDGGYFRAYQCGHAFWDKDAGNKTKGGKITEVSLRERSTPYDFAVTIAGSDGCLDLYRGQSYKNALGAYWQAVGILRFIHSSGKVAISLSVEGQPYGGFETLVPGERDTTHVPFGECIGWAYRKVVAKDLPEFVIATIPGMLRPIRHPRRN